MILQKSFSYPESPRSSQVVPSAGHDVLRFDAPLLSVLAAEAEMRPAAVVQQRDAVGRLRVAAVAKVHRLRTLRVLKPYPESQRVTWRKDCIGTLPPARSMNPCATAQNSRRQCGEFWLCWNHHCVCSHGVLRVSILGPPAFWVHLRTAENIENYPDETDESCYVENEGKNIVKGSNRIQISIADIPGRINALT